jgi:hypothetical protein
LQKREPKRLKSLRRAQNCDTRDGPAAREREKPPANLLSSNGFGALLSCSGIN